MAKKSKTTKKACSSAGTRLATKGTTRSGKDLQKCKK